jgi:hypothetical protein
MKHLILFEKFKETKKNTPIVYQDDNLIIKVPKTLDSSKMISDPQWCSTSPDGFYKHNLTANMYRFIFKDGYKLRLTWDYKPGQTHWGCGGELNGEKVWYSTIRPKDENEPFYFDFDHMGKWEREDVNRKMFIDRIKSIPENAIQLIKKYQQQNKPAKDALYRNLYNEINKITVINVENIDDEYGGGFKVTILYNDKKYEILAGHTLSETSLKFSFYKTEFKKKFKNQYFFMEYETINSYLTKKTLEWLETNDKEEYLKFKDKYKINTNRSYM